MPHSLDYTIRTNRRAKKIAELLTRHVFRLDARLRADRRRQTVAQIQAAQRQVFTKIRVRFVDQHGQIEGSRLAQVTVDKLFGRPTAPKGDDACLAVQFAAEIASECPQIRNAAFISLLAMLAVESADNHLAATRRITETIQWLRRFGEIPTEAGDASALGRIGEQLRPCTLSTSDN